MGEKGEGRLAVKPPTPEEGHTVGPLQWALAETRIQRNFLPALLSVPGSLRELTAMP